MLRTGVDLLHLDRFGRVLKRYPARFPSRVYTERERRECGHDLQSLAGRFALKEAAAKVLGTGLWRSGVAWQHIEIVRNPATGEPTLQLHAAAARIARQQQLYHWSVSLSHDGKYVLAFAVACPAIWGAAVPRAWQTGSSEQD